MHAHAHINAPTHQLSITGDQHKHEIAITVTAPPSRDSTPSPTEPSLRTPPLTPVELNNIGLGLAGVPLSLEAGTRTSTSTGSNAHATPGKGSGSGSGSGSMSRRGSIRREAGTIVGIGGPSGSSSGSGSGSAVSASGSRRVSSRAGEDEGLVMREKGDEGSVGRAGGVDVGVTRPKRRLSRFVWSLCFRWIFWVSSVLARGAFVALGFVAHGAVMSRSACWLLHSRRGGAGRDTGMPARRRAAGARVTQCNAMQLQGVTVEQD